MQLAKSGAIGSVVERIVHIDEAAGSIPALPTIQVLHISTIVKFYIGAIIK